MNPPGIPENWLRRSSRCCWGADALMIAAFATRQAGRCPVVRRYPPGEGGPSTEATDIASRGRWVVHEGLGRPPFVQRLLERVEHEVGLHRGADAPADDGPC